MKQAIRENRQGKVRVSEEIVVDAGPKMALLRSRMEVLEEVPELYSRCRWLIGYSPEFEPLELGRQPPEYVAVFATHSEGQLAGLTELYFCPKVPEVPEVPKVPEVPASPGPSEPPPPWE